MRTKTLDAPVDLATLAEAARREPVTVLSNGEPAFVALSPSEYARLSRRAAEYEESADRLLSAVRAMQQTAAARGLTDAELERLLADES
jgi:prevent-host-death family protein